MTEKATSKETLDQPPVAVEPTATPQQSAETSTTEHPQASTLGLASMILGIVSFTGPGLLLGIPAIIMAAIDLKKKPINRGFAITGLVTGIISTVLSVLVIALVVFLSIWSYQHPEDFENYYNDTPPVHQFKSSEL
jgi:hypothetical protein